MSSLRRGRLASPARLRRAVVVGAMLVGAGACLRIAGLKRTQIFIGRIFGGRERLGAGEGIEEVLDAVQRDIEAIDRILPYRSSCLERALVVWCFTIKCGAPGILRIGVRRKGERIQAHAWVECEDLSCGVGRESDTYAPFDGSIDLRT